MNSESSYIYSDSQKDQGLGRIPPLTLSRSLPTINKPTVRNRRIIQPKRITLPKPTIKPRLLPKLRPAIDKNPLHPPARVKPIPRRITKPKKRSKSDKKLPHVSAFRVRQNRLLQKRSIEVEVFWMELSRSEA